MIIVRLPILLITLFLPYFTNHFATHSAFARLRARHDSLGCRDYGDTETTPYFPNHIFFDIHPLSLRADASNLPDGRHLLDRRLHFGKRHHCLTAIGTLGIADSCEHVANWV